MKKTILHSILLAFFMLTSISLSAQKFYPERDTYINQASAEYNMNLLPINGGYPARLEVRKNSGSGNERITLLEFNIGSYNKQTTKAELNMYMYQAGNANNAVKTETVEAYDFGNYIIADNTRWSNIGPYTLGAALASQTITITGGGDALNNNTTANGWYKFDITSLVNTVAATSGTDKKIKLLLKNATANLVIRFFSTEAPSYTNDGQSDFPVSAEGKEPFLEIAESTGINAANADELVSIYKNSNNQITINCKASLSENASAMVYNVTGQKLATIKLETANTTINKGFGKGIYMVKVTNAGVSTSQKVILN
jgi:hypothetical protein